LLGLILSYSNLQIDEAHERSAYTDLLLGLLKKSVPAAAGFDFSISSEPYSGRIRRKRPELRIIISSATIDA
jgi:ATP-dependent RNA helicase DDX35